MRTYSIIAEVIQTRVYNVTAPSADHAEEMVRDEFEVMNYDVLEEVVDNTEVEEVNG